MSYPRSLIADTGSLLTPADPTRLSAWGQLGTPVAGARHARQALVTAGLAGWNIRKLIQGGTELTESGVTRIENPDKVMLVYTDPATRKTRYLSTVGKDYGIHQNEAGADVIDTLVAETGARGIGYAGAIEGGRKTFVTIELPGTMYIDGVDALQLHLVVFTSHDGEAAFRVMILPFRPICANQLNVAVRKQKASVSINHTSKSEISVEKIRSDLGVLYQYGDAFQAEANRMLRTEMTNAEFADLIREVWPLKDNAPARAVNNDRRRTSTLTRLWTSAQTQEPIRNTRWAANNVITEYFDHCAPAKDRATRATRVVASSTVAKMKQTAFDLLTT